MHRTNTLFAFFASVMIILSCTGGREHVANTNFTFVVRGAINGGEGQQLALTIPGQNLDDRMISTIHNGQVEFSGRLTHPQRAVIVMETEISEPDGNQANFHLFLNQDTVEFSADFVEDLYYPGLANTRIHKGDINAYYHDHIDIFYEPANGLRIRSDEKYMDSLRRDVFPAIRARQLDLYDQYFADPRYASIGVYVLRSILDKNVIYPFASLDAAEKARITRYFHKIDTSLSNTIDYQLACLYVEKMNAGSQSPAFHDFTLMNADGSTSRLSAIVRKNKITVLDFWWYGCVPCRKFNREMRQHYSLLRSHGIEIVGINTDGGIERWKKASAQDSIAWVDLYAGEKSPAEIVYDVTYAPFKVVVDSDFTILDVKANTVEDLIKAASLKN